MLRWLRGRRVIVGFPLAVLAAGVATFFAWRGIADAIMSFAAYAAFSLGIAAVFLIPYFVDRALATRRRDFLGTLFFPGAVVTMEYVFSLVSPLGTWNAVAYTQVHNLPLIQIASLTGLYGVSFLVAWFAAVVNWAWENRESGPGVRRGIIVYGTVLAAVLLFGGIRLAADRPGETVRVAGVISKTFFLSEHPELLPPLTHGEPLDEAETAALHEETAAINDDLLARSRREARAGARVVVWGECSAQLPVEDEPALIRRGRDLAREEGIYLGMGLATLEPGTDKPVTNKLVLVDPDGEVVWDYVKSIPVPGPEATISRRGDCRLPTLDTEYGRLAGAICYDMDFPATVRQAGRAGADIMIVPSHDWYELMDLHAELATFRAVENGFSLLRPDNEAVSVAVDYLGRPIAAMDYFAAADPVIVADVPTRGVRTVYAAVGDIFAWFVIAAFVCISGITLFRMRK
jgi:apolipoprotein N-acyltransferase